MDSGGKIRWKGSVRGILLLGRIQGDLQGLLFFVHIVNLAERLEALSDDLDLNFALRDSGDAGLSILAGAKFEGCPDGFAELHDGMSLDELDHHAGAFHRFAALALDHDIDLGHRRSHGVRGKRAKYEERHCELTKDVTPKRHTPIINVRRAGGW